MLFHSILVWKGQFIVFDWDVDFVELGLVEFGLVELLAWLFMSSDDFLTVKALSALKFSY